MSHTDTDAFWTVMDECVVGAASVDEIYGRVLSYLVERPLNDIVAFDRGLSFAIYEADTPAMREAALLIVDGGGDDYFLGFRCWLVCWLGKTDFYRAIADPDSLADLIPDGEWPMFEEFGAIAAAAYEQASDGASIEDLPESWNVPRRPHKLNSSRRQRTFPRLKQRFPQPM